MDNMLILAMNISCDGQDFGRLIKAQELAETWLYHWPVISANLFHCRPSWPTINIWWSCVTSASKHLEILFFCSESLLKNDNDTNKKKINNL